MAGNDKRADGDFLAVSMDVMCATKIVIVSAAGEGRAEMVTTALTPPNPNPNPNPSPNHNSPNPYPPNPKP